MGMGEAGSVDVQLTFHGCFDFSPSSTVTDIMNFLRVPRCRFLFHHNVLGTMKRERQEPDSHCVKRSFGSSLQRTL